jgi:integrase
MVFYDRLRGEASEALNARWAEIDLAKRLWTLSPERMKSSKQHTVPLSSAALAVLERQARVRAGEAVFPGRSGSPLNYNSFATAPAKAGIDAACPHGWRSVFRDWAGDIGEISRDLAEAALAHSLGATEGAYRRLTAVERRRAVMEAYARWLNDDNAKVVASRQAKPPEPAPMRMDEELPLYDEQWARVRRRRPDCG